MNILNVSTDKLSALLRMTPKKDVRFYLLGVYVDTVNEALVATDGNALMAIKQPIKAIWRHKCKPFIIPAAVVRDAVNAAKRSDVLVSIDPPEDRRDRLIELMAEKDHGARAMGKEIDGNYPDWRRVVPTAVSSDPVHAVYEPIHLERLTTAMMLARGLDSSRGGNRVPAIHSVDPNAGALVTMPDSEILGVLMPMRDIGGGDRLTEGTNTLAAFGFKPGDNERWRQAS